MTKDPEAMSGDQFGLSHEMNPNGVEIVAGRARSFFRQYYELQDEMSRIPSSIRGSRFSGYAGLSDRADKTLINAIHLGWALDQLAPLEGDTHWYDELNSQALSEIEEEQQAS